MNKLVLLVSVTCVLFTAAASGANLTRGPHTTDNEDSCDIAVAPAATLLLPFFEVDLDDQRRRLPAGDLRLGGQRPGVHERRWRPRGRPRRAPELGDHGHAGRAALFHRRGRTAAAEPGGVEGGAVSDYTDEDSTILPGPAEDVNP